MKFFGENGWISLHKALLEASTIETNRLLKGKDDKDKLKSFFERGLLESLENTNEDIVVLADARLRKWWDSFKNGTIHPTKLPIHIDYPNYKERVRFVRVNHTDELPQYRINPKGKEKVNRQSGLFYDSNGIYYSIGIRPDTMQNTSHPEQKFNSPNKHFLHQRLIEIIPLGATELEEHEQLANLVYQMRRLNIAYDAHTIFPYPLHIVNSLRKYMTFLNSEFESTEFDETVILGDSEKIELALH